MKPYQTAEIRNVALLGQAGSGKTSLLEAIAFETGVIKRKGTIEDGTTLSDIESEEIAHHRSTTMTMTTVPIDGGKLNLFDTPGSSDFIGEVIPAITGSELVVLTVSATDNLGPDVERLWRLAEEAKIPVVLFITKLDRENADFERTVDAIRTSLTSRISLIDIPLGNETSLRGVADVLFETTVTYDSGSKSIGQIPRDLEAKEHEEHEHLVEDVIEEDDALMERYLEGEEPHPDTVETLLAERFRARKVFPVICGSSTKQIGIDILVKYLLEIGVAPKEEGRAKDLLAQVLKTYIDPYLGKISLVKIFKGALIPDETCFNIRRQAPEKIHTVFQKVGKDISNLTSACEGDIVFVSKQVNLSTSDTLASSLDQAPLPEIALPLSTYSVVVTAENKADDEKLFSTLLKISEEEPVLSVKREARSHRIVCSGLGDTHISNVLEKVSRRAKVSASFQTPEIEYLETIEKSARAEGKYKKQSGGHGQYGVVDLVVEPLARGQGFEFIDEIVGGAIPRNFIPAVEKGVVEAMESGGPNGYPVVDVKVRLVDGKYHPVDSSEMSFKVAGALGFRTAISNANPVVLEPVAHVYVTVPIRYQGDVLGDLSSKRAQVLGTQNDHEDLVTVQALVPEAELSGYTLHLRSITGGRASFSATRHGYQALSSKPK